LLTPSNKGPVQRGTRPDTGCPSATFADGLSAPTVLILVNRFFLSGRFFPTYIFFHAEKIKATRVRIVTPVDELSAPIPEHDTLSPMDELSAPIPEHDTPSLMDEQVAPVGVRPWAVKGQDVGTFEPASILAALPGFGGIGCAQLNGKSMRQLGRGQQDGKGRDVGGFFVVADAAAALLFDEPKHAGRWANDPKHVNIDIAESLAYAAAGILL